MGSVNRIGISYQHQPLKLRRSLSLGRGEFVEHPNKVVISNRVGTRNE